MRIVIPGRFPSLNEYIRVCRASPQAANRFKARYERSIRQEIMAQTFGLAYPKPPVTLHYTFFEPDRRRDQDNVYSMFSKLFQDSLVKERVLENDGWAYILGFSAQFDTDKDNPRIEIDIEEAKL